MAPRRHAAEAEAEWWLLLCLQKSAPQTEGQFSNHHLLPQSHFCGMEGAEDASKSQPDHRLSG